jgi:hypothetical protein
VLSLPGQASATPVEPEAAEQQSLDPLTRGPEITETR